MSIFNGKRLPQETFKMTDEIVDNLRSGWYSDDYFNNTVRLLTALSENGYVFGDKENDLTGKVSVVDVQNGDIVIEMQFFTRRKPFSVVAGVDEALAILKVAAGYYDKNGQFVSTFDRLEIEAVQDGDRVYYDGNPLNIQPVIKVRGRYRDFGHLETTMLGVMAVPTRIATNVYNVLKAAKGKPVLFFPARFDHYKMQAIDGYAYWIAVQRYNLDFKGIANPSISTNEQGDWWGGEAGGTISHSTIACFFGNTAEAMMQFAKYMPVNIPRIALVDYHNDCVGETRKVMKEMFDEYWKLYSQGNLEEAWKYRLDGIRPDTSSNMRDKSIIPQWDKKKDFGVSPQLVGNLRDAIDNAWKDWVLEESFAEIQQQKGKIAKEWCEKVKIVVTGGFTAEKISEFEDLGVPVDIYGVGSSLLENSEMTNNDFTADIVRVFIDGQWYEEHKTGRGPCNNPNLKQL